MKSVRIVTFTYAVYLISRVNKGMVPSQTDPDHPTKLDSYLLMDALLGEVADPCIELIALPFALPSITTPWEEV